MILLDINIVSEVMKASPAGSVLAWLNGQDSDKLFSFRDHYK
jgi:predicted nucleic acid-binding protein